MELFMQIVVIVLLVLATFFSWKSFQYTEQLYTSAAASQTAAAA